MATIIVKMQVNDFDLFSANFASNDEARGRFGFLSHVVSRNVNNPSEVVVVSRVRDLQEALGFFRDPEVRARMGQAGGGVAPEVLHLDDVAEKTY